VSLSVLLAVLSSLVTAASARLVERDVAIRLRDGVVLRADVWRPAASGRFPVLVYRTPYDRRRAQGERSTVARAAERGYAVVVQDVRGRYGSDGEFEPYRNEGRDGYDTIEWAAAQAWSDGAVGTFGAFDMSWTAWIWNNIAPDVRVRRGLAGPRTRPVQDPYATLPGAHDYRMLPEHEDVITLETAPLEEELRIVGPIAAHMYVSTDDARDVDIWVKLFDVAPDGTAFNLMSPGLDVLRASYRRARGRPRPRPPGPGASTCMNLRDIPRAWSSRW